MADLKTTFCGVTLDNPFILGSCPLSYSADGMIRAAKAGAAAVVTKTIRTRAAINPKPHMASIGNNSLINTELWSDYPPEQWIKTEIPKAKDAGIKCLIASIIVEDNDADIFLSLARPVVEAGADMIEVGGGSYFESGELVEFGKKLKRELKVPLIVKINNNWSNADQIARQCHEAGFDAITAMDSMGPTMRFDLKTGAPLVGGYNGAGWVTGATLLPFTLQVVHNLAAEYRRDIMGLGGIIQPSDAMEMLMAGASACGVCTAPILRGISYFSKLVDGLHEELEKYGYKGVRDVIGLSLEYDDINEDYSAASFQYDRKICTRCKRCELVCPYGARTLEGADGMRVNEEQCRVCGLCFTVCPTKAIIMR